MKKLVGLSIGALQRKYGDMRAIEIAREIGADAVDFNLDDANNDYRNSDSLYSKGKEAIIEYYSDIKSKADSLGIIINQTHGKLDGIIGDKGKDDALVKNTELDCLATSVMGAEVCVIHNTSTIPMGPDASAELMHKLSYNLFTRVLPFAKQYNIKIATETFGDALIYPVCDFFGNIDEFDKAYKAIKDIDELKDYFTICMDTGHSNKAKRFGNPTPADVIRRLGKEVTVLHLHDNDTITDQHKIPMTGTIDWNDTFNALDEIGYSGVYNLELNLGHFGQEFLIETAEFGIKVMKNILRERYGE